MKIGIIGLGLMGGSLALSLKHLPFISEIVGMDKDKEHQRQALELSLVEKIVEFDEIQKCNVIVLCVPVVAIINILQTFNNISDDTTIIDFGGTKEKIIQNIPDKIRKNFVATHPMTGTEFFGPSAAVENLYKDKIIVFCNFAESGQKQQTIAIRVFSALRMKITYMTAKEHDRHAAFISHMPHAISYSLANTVLKQENTKDILTLAAGGFRSMSRLAKSSPNMWEDVFKQNRENILEAIDLFESELQKFKKYIKQQQWKELNQEMQNANSLHSML